MKLIFVNGLGIINITNRQFERRSDAFCRIVVENSQPWRKHLDTLRRHSAPSLLDET